MLCTIVSIEVGWSSGLLRRAEAKVEVSYPVVYHIIVLHINFLYNMVYNNVISVLYNMVYITVLKTMLYNMLCIIFSIEVGWSWRTRPFVWCHAHWRALGYRALVSPSLVIRDRRPKPNTCRATALSGVTHMFLNIFL